MPDGAPSKQTPIGVQKHGYTLTEVRIMGNSTLSSREFDQDTSPAKKPAMNGPVFIADRQLSGGKTKIADLLSMQDGEDFELEIPKLQELAKHAELQ